MRTAQLVYHSRSPTGTRAVSHESAGARGGKSGWHGNYAEPHLGLSRVWTERGDLTVLVAVDAPQAAARVVVATAAAPTRDGRYSSATRLTTGPRSSRTYALPTSLSRSKWRAFRRASPKAAQT